MLFACAQCGGLAAEAESRVTQWRLGCALDYPPGWPEYDWEGALADWPARDLVPNGRDVPACPLSTLGMRILGAEPWP